MRRLEQEASVEVLFADARHNYEAKQCEQDRILGPWARLAAWSVARPLEEEMKGTFKYGALACVFGLAAIGSAQLYSENFDVDPTANWVVNKGPNPGGSFANFFFDYSSYGIPSAPNSGGTTRGLRLEANVVGGVFSGLSVSPVGQSFTGDYEVHADMWWNFVGPGPIGGSGSTQAGGLGIGTSGAVPQWAGGTQDSVWFACTTDGNSSVDWRAYSTAAPTGYPDGSTVFAAAGPGNRNHSHPYYAGFGGVALPATQAAIFPTQTGTTLVGSVGFEWHDVVVKKLGNTITWTMDGLLIATIDATTVTLGGSNIHFNYFDTNATSTTDPNRLNFVLVDNVRVVPEPATLATLGLGALALLRRRKR